MKVLIVCGGRDFRNWEHLSSVLYDVVRQRQYDCIVHGAANGADVLSRTWARAEGLDVVEFPANWTGRGKGAGFYRNKLMASFASEHDGGIVAFRGGNGTSNMWQVAKKHNLVLEWNDNNGS